MPQTDIQTVVIGAGVVGLATAAALAASGHDVVVIEREKSIGQGVSSRNSEVIHAGIYYAPGSVKAKLCVAGREQLYQYCGERHIPFERIGKLIVATDQNDIEALNTLYHKAMKNGVNDLRRLDAQEAMDRQPGLHCTAALHSPSTGIVDSHSLMLSLQADIESNGGNVVCQTAVEKIQHDSDHFKVTLADGTLVTTGNIVNSTGLHSVELANTIEALDKQTIPKARYAKGNYFKFSGDSASQPPFSTLIYPAPVVGGLGIHLTIDLAGEKRFGPDVEWLTDNTLNAPDYQADPSRCKSFYAAIRKYWPDLPDDSLVPDYAGIRPKIEPANSAEIDFEISTEHHHGIAGLVNLYGIESPGLTASLAIAESIKRTL